jgi:uncharacterized Zn finger protein
MEQKASEGIRKKGQLLFEQGRTRKELETDKRIHFRVKGETETHLVIFDKEKNEYSCDCRYFALTQKTCSHIVASDMFKTKV